MVWNFIVLALVSLVPFASGLIGMYEYDWIAVAIFAVVLGGCGFAIGLFARHAATEAHLHRTGEVTDVLWHRKYHSRILPLVDLTSILLLTVEEVASLVVWAIERLRGSVPPDGIADRRRFTWPTSPSRTTA